MTLRSNRPDKQAAHRLLDEVRAGVAHPAELIARALAALGEPVGCQ